MSTPPAAPKIYHITHVDNLANIVSDACIWSDAQKIARGITGPKIGMSKIKRRRLHEIEVYCHGTAKVGEFAAFYFCPRSVMLYLIHMDNHEELTYHGGQEPIVHLKADFHAVVKWADDNRVNWAFSEGNAGAFAATFYNDLDDLSELNWPAIQGTNFSTRELKEGKQAEFLVYSHLPWHLIEEVGVMNTTRQAEVEGVLAGLPHRPPVRVARAWYY